MNNTEKKINMVNDVKNHLKKLLNTIQPISKYFNSKGSFPEYRTVNVLIKNACFGDTNDSNIESEYNKIYDIYELIKKIALYIENDHVISFIEKEYGAILTTYYYTYFDEE